MRWLVGITLLGLLAGGFSGCDRKDKVSIEMWGGGADRGCLPCHQYRLPIARSHNYRCDTCHGGQPGAKDKEIAHRELFPHPQDEEVIAFTCQKCHNERLGYDIPYDSDFVLDVLISHGDYVE